MAKVYFWGGEHHSPKDAGGWLTVTFAAAVDSVDELRRLCEQHQVKRPSKPHQPKPGRDESGGSHGPTRGPRLPQRGIDRRRDG